MLNVSRASWRRVAPCEKVQAMVTDDLGERISAARRSRRLSQKQLAILVGVSARTLGSWERDPRASRVVTYASLQRLDEALGTHFADGSSTPSAEQTMAPPTTVPTTGDGAVPAVSDSLPSVVSDPRGAFVLRPAGVSDAEWGQMESDLRKRVDAWRTLLAQVDGALTDAGLRPPAASSTGTAASSDGTSTPSSG